MYKPAEPKRRQFFKIATAGTVASAPIRIRAAEPDLYAAVKTHPDRVGAPGFGGRLGRSAHADHRGTAPPRRSAGSDPRFRRSYRTCQGQQHRRCGDVRFFRARSVEPHGAEIGRAHV